MGKENTNDLNSNRAIKYLNIVIPASEARRESFLKTKKDSGQAGMTALLDIRIFNYQSNSKKLKYFKIFTSGNNGFTLLELVIVIAILGLLAAIIAPKMMGRADDAKITDAKLQIRNLETALKLFKLDNGFYPDTQQGLEALIEKPATGQIPQKYKEGGYLEQKKIPLDPWGNPYIYVSPGLHGDFDILSYGSDGKEGGTGKDADINNWEL